MDIPEVQEIRPDPPSKRLRLPLDAHSADRPTTQDLPFYKTARTASGRSAGRHRDRGEAAPRQSAAEDFRAASVDPPGRTACAPKRCSRLAPVGQGRAAEWSGCNRGLAGVEPVVIDWPYRCPDRADQQDLAIFKHESQKDKALFPGPFDAADSGSVPRPAHRHRRLFNAWGLRISRDGSVAGRGSG